MTLVVLSAVLFFPSKGWSVRIDPYAYTTVIGTVFFEYENQSRKEQTTGFLDKSSTFRQNYGLSLRGNFFSRLLMIYDASFDFERETYTTNFSDRTTHVFYFDLSTTILPRSRIPLTLFGSRSDSIGVGDNKGVKTGTTTTAVGLNWTGKFRVLPRLNFNISRNVTGVEGGEDNKETRLFFNADKDYGPTTNQLRYTGSFRDDTSGASTSNTNLGLNNATRLSRHSNFNLGLTRDVSDTADQGTAKTFGLTMALSSQPSRFFNQSHYVTYYRTDAPETSYSGTTYAGSLRYDISRKLSSNVSLSITKVFAETLTSSEDTTSTNAGGTLQYRISDHWFTSQSLSVLFTESSASEQGLANLSDKKRIYSSSNLSYQRSFSRASFSASYGLGYLYDTDISLNLVEDGGQAITHNGSINLNRINVTRFFFFDTGATFNRILKTTGGTVNEDRNRFTARFYNRFWKKYLKIDGGFKKYKQKTAVEAIEEKGETSDLTVTATPIRGGRLSLNLQRIVFFNDFAGFSNSNSGQISAGYGRRLFGGNLSCNILYSVLDRTFQGGADVTLTASYELGYERSLLRRVMWKFNALKTDSTIDEFLSRYTIISNTAFYRLRAWSFSVTHSYSIQEDSTREERENKVLFKVGRQFIRRF